MSVEERNTWIRLFNRLDAAVSRHRRVKSEVGFCDDTDDSLHAAHDRILKAASAASDANMCAEVESPGDVVSAPRLGNEERSFDAGTA